MDKFLTEMETLFTVCLFMALPVRPERAGVGCRKNIKPVGYIPALRMILSSEAVQAFENKFLKMITKLPCGHYKHVPSKQSFTFHSH